MFQPFECPCCFLSNQVEEGTRAWRPPQEVPNFAHGNRVLQCMLRELIDGSLAQEPDPALNEGTHFWGARCWTCKGLVSALFESLARCTRTKHGSLKLHFDVCFACWAVAQSSYFWSGCLRLLEFNINEQRRCFIFP